MKNRNLNFRNGLASIFLIFLLGLNPANGAGQKRLQIEMYGGISYLEPKDLNLLSAAEEQYNDFYFIQRQLYKRGYFINDFPEINRMLPAGLGLKYWISPVLAFSVSAERFFRRKELSVEGTLSYVQPTWFDNQTKSYDPFSLELSGMAVMGGLYYRIPINGQTDMEIGASAGWGKANFKFGSTWSHTVHFWAENYWEFQSEDGGTLEGDGSGNGLLAKADVRLNQRLGSGLGFFIEASGVICRMKSFAGSGRETRLGIPGEISWEGNWGIKREELHLGMESATVYVPSNYWESWMEAQWDRDFVLDLSRVQLVLGFFLMF